MKYLHYVIGLFILTLGIAFTIQSDLGASPYDALLVGLFKTIGLSVGSWEVILALVTIGLIALLKKQRPVFSGLLTAVVTGMGIDFWLFLLPHLLAVEALGSRLLLFAAGILCIGLGTAVYLYADFAPMPFDHLMLVIQERTGKSVLFARTIIYLVSLTLAFLFDGPIGMGTILTVLTGGPMLNFFMKRIANKRQPMIKAVELSQSLIEKEKPGCP